MDTWPQVANTLKSYEGQIKRSYKCLNKKTQIRSDTVEKHKKILLDNFELLRRYLNDYLDKLTSEHNKVAIAIYDDCRDRILKVSAKHNLHIKIPHSLTEGAVYAQSSENEDFSESEADDNKHILKTGTSSENVNMTQTNIQFLQTVSRILPDFDGRSENLQSFIDALSIVESIKDTHEALAVNLVKTKLKGTARNLISTETTLQEIIIKLRNTVKGDTVDVLSAKLMSAKQQGKDTTSYVREVEELTKALEGAYMADGLSLETAGKYATQVAVKSLTKNTQSEQVRVVIRAGQFQNMNELIAKYVNTCAETNVSSVMHYRDRKGRPFRGRGRNNNHSNGNSNNESYNQNSTGGRNYNNNRGRGHRGYNNSNSNNGNYNNGRNNDNNRNRTNNVRVTSQQERESEN